MSRLTKNSCMVLFFLLVVFFVLGESEISAQGQNMCCVPKQFLITYYQTAQQCIDAGDWPNAYFYLTFLSIMLTNNSWVLADQATIQEIGRAQNTVYGKIQQMKTDAQELRRQRSAQGAPGYEAGWGKGDGQTSLAAEFPYLRPHLPLR